jgi:hypothetical protein
MEKIKKNIYYCSFVLFFILYYYGFSMEPKKVLIAMLLTAFYYTYISFRNNFILDMKGVVLLNLPFVVFVFSVGIIANAYSNVLYYSTLIPITSFFGYYFFKTKSIMVLLATIGISILVYFYYKDDLFDLINNIF